MPNIGDVFSHADTRSLAPAAVGSQVLLMTVVSVRLSTLLLTSIVIHLNLQLVTIVFFNVLRPKNKASALIVKTSSICMLTVLPLDRLRAQSQVSCR